MKIIEKLVCSCGAVEHRRRELSEDDRRGFSETDGWKPHIDNHRAEIFWQKDYGMKPEDADWRGK